MVFLDKVKPARRLARKAESINSDSVHNTAKNRKERQKIAFSLTKFKAGDHKPRPARKTPAVSKLTRLLRVKQVFIILRGLSAWGRKRTRDISRPIRLNTPRRFRADMMAEL